MSTIRQLVGSAIIQLQQTGDDQKIPDNQLYLWGTWLVNKYMSFKFRTADSGAFRTIMPSVPVVKAPATVTPDIINGEKYSALPRTVLDLEEDRGIDITYSRNDYPVNVDLGVISPFTRISYNQARRLYYSEYERPSASNPYWYRHGNYIGYLGIKNANISTVEMGLVTEFDPFVTHSIDDHLDVLTEYADDIFKDMIEMGRFALLVPTDRINDGSGEAGAEQVPQQRVTSVNKSVENMFNTEE